MWTFLRDFRFFNRANLSTEYRLAEAEPSYISKTTAVLKPKKKGKKMSSRKPRTKAYTLNRLISEVNSLNASKASTFSQLVSSLSPVKGASSAKIKVLNSFLNGKLSRVASNTQLGSSVKQRVLRALKTRKRNGSF